MKHFVIKSLSIFGFDPIKFLLLVKWESTRGSEEPPLSADGRKIGEKSKKEEFQIRNL